MVPYNGEYLLFKGADGVPLTPIGFMQRFVEWGAGRSGFVDAHIQKPADAYWRVARASSDGKAGFIRESNGNRVEDTLYCHMQVYWLLLKSGRPSLSVRPRALLAATSRIGRSASRAARAPASGVLNPTSRRAANIAGGLRS